MEFRVGQEFVSRKDGFKVMVTKVTAKMVKYVVDGQDTEFRLGFKAFDEKFIEVVVEIVDDGKLNFNQWLQKYHELEESDITEEYYMKRDCVSFEEAKGLVDNIHDEYGDYLEANKVEESPEVVEPTRKVWILEKWITREHMEKEQKNFAEGLAVAKEQGKPEVINALQEAVDMYARNLEKYPDGYWLGWGGKAIYKEFKHEAMGNIVAHRKMDKNDCTFRVVTARIPESSKTWIGYKNPVEDTESLQDLYNTIEGGI